jgi:secreted PhoX family phosphatase
MSDKKTRRDNSAPTFAQVVDARLSRRSFLTLGATGAALSFLGRPALALSKDASPSLTFTEIPHGLDADLHLAPGHLSQVLLAWGDPLQKGDGPFDPSQQSLAQQEKRFGYDNDFIAYRPFKKDPNHHGLLCVNHEQALPNLMFPRKNAHTTWPAISRWEAEIEMAANGHSVVEIKREKKGHRWQVIPGRYNRRFTANSTPMTMSGPAAGSPRLKTRDDPTGRTCLGTFANCGGGVTPWGTVLISEENFDAYFIGDPTGTPEERNHKRYSIQNTPYQVWGRYFERFDVRKENNEPNRFGWVVEFDPFDPKKAPRKCTALGRFKHESATCALAKDGRLVVYSGDDEGFEYLYRYVSRGRYQPERGHQNSALLDDGELSVARFSKDGTLVWIPLRFGEGPLTAREGFFSPADVLIEARRAGDLLGGTPMDRPEGIEVHPRHGRVYVSLTKNRKREPKDTSSLHPRAPNPHGQIVELIPPSTGGTVDHGADTFRWEILVLGGNPQDPKVGARVHPKTTAAGWFSCPDNLGFDPAGRLWISTDGLRKVAGVADGLWAMAVDGSQRALPRHFLRAPVGAEVCSPAFTPDGTTLFVGIQHPGAVKGASYQSPPTRWPDFKKGSPTRPGVCAIRRRDGQPIGK